MIMFFAASFRELEKEWYIVVICLSFCIYYVMYELAQPIIPIQYFFFAD